MLVYVINKKNILKSLGIEHPLQNSGMVANPPPPPPPHFGAPGVTSRIFC